MTLLALGLLAAAPHTVAVDLSALDRASYQELDAVGLERAVVVRLVQEGFAAVATTASPEIRIRLTRRGRVAQLSCGEAEAKVELDPKRLREFHLEVAQKSAELARAAAAALDAKPPPPVEPPPEPKPQPPPDEPPPPPPPPAPSWNVLAGGGVLIRAPGIDPRAVLAARFAATRTLGLHLEVGLAFVPGATFSAYDGSLLAGGGLELLHGAFRLEVGLAVGAMLHTFTLITTGTVEPLGSRVDFLARPFLRATLNPASGLLVWVQVGAGLSSRAREHRLLGEVQYYRGALWLDLTAGLGWET